MNKSTLAFLILFVAFSCTEERNKNQQANILEETPKVLDDDKSDVKLSSYSRRMNKDIIQQLFDEALDKDEKLRSINSRISKIQNTKTDSLEEYQTYIRNNQIYWKSLKQYASQLNDTTAREELKDMIETLENLYTSEISSLDSLEKQIVKREQKLEDQEILMKIFITHPMMSNYQRNEFPDINTLKSVNEMYDTLIRDIETYTEIKK